MAINSEALKERLRDTFGTDSQETVGNKLSMTQGNVSKLLSGTQQPTLETVYHIAKTYGVSVDWLLGLTDEKRITHYSTKTTYASAVKTLMDLKSQGAKIEQIKEDHNIIIQADDILLFGLMKKALALEGADYELFHNWVDTKLSLFEDKRLLWKESWEERNIYLFTNEALPEINWIQFYERAENKEKRLQGLFGPDESVF